MNKKPKILSPSKYPNIEYARSVFGDSLLILPCGKCLGCSKQYSKEWATRIMLEASLYENNCFITLTYNDDHLPDKGDNRDFQLFMKRLRKHFDGIGIRYFGCGEYGSSAASTHRFHYHAILFNIDFDDKVFLKRTTAGELIYTSKTLQDLWSDNEGQPIGICSIGEVTSSSAAYVARYSMKKKLTGFEDGSFVFMSRRPGIAAGQMINNWFTTSKIYTEAGICSIPRFFKKCMEKYDKVFYVRWKEQQREMSKNNDYRWFFNVENEEEARKYMEKCEKLRYKEYRE